jgi:hypothetical protein
MCKIRGGFRWACTFAIIVTALPSLAFGAGSSFRSSRSFAASSPHLQQSFSQPLNRSGMFDVDESDEVEVIIQQSQSAPITEPRKPAKKGNLRSATLGGLQLWSAGFRTRALDRPGERAGALTMSASKT